MGVTTTKINKPFNPRGNDQSPLAYNRAALYSGKALDFDGVNDYVDLDGFTMAGDVATIVFYGKFSNDGRILDLNPNRFIIENTASSGLRVYNNTSYNVYGTTDRDKVGFYAIVSDGTTQRAYYNGHQLGSDETITALDWDSVTNMKLGAYFGGGSVFLDGQIAGFKIFNTALTAAQIADLYNNPEKVVPTGVDNTALKLWLPMMEGAGTTAYDGSGNGNHGTISGATYVNGIGAPVAQSAVMDWNKGVNHLAYSNELDNAYWSKGGTTITANYAEAPNGLTTADKIVSTAATGEQRVYKASGLTTVGNTYTYHAFVKADGANWLVCRDDFRGYGDTSFDLVNGVVGTTASGRTASITAFGDYYFVAVQVTITASVVSGQVMFCLADVDNGRAGFIGDGTKGIVFWGAGINDGTSVVHIPTIATAQTTPVLLPQGLTTGRDITGVNLFENVRKQGALNLDGNSWAEVHDNASLDVSDEVTLEAWVYWDGTASDDGILGRWGDSSGDKNYMLYAASSTKVNFYINNSDSFYSSMTTGWRHIVGTYDKVNRKLYVDGVLRDTDAMTDAIATSDKPIEIGRYRYGAGGTRLYTNQLAQPRIYNRALTAEEVQRSYDSGKNIFTNS